MALVWTGRIAAGRAAAVSSVGRTASGLLRPGRPQAGLLKSAGASAGAMCMFVAAPGRSLSGTATRWHKDDPDCGCDGPTIDQLHGERDACRVGVRRGVHRAHTPFMRQHSMRTHAPCAQLHDRRFPFPAHQLPLIPGCQRRRPFTRGIPRLLTAHTSANLQPPLLRVRVKLLKFHGWGQQVPPRLPAFF